VAWLEELYVAPERRNLGVGRRLVDAVAERAAARGCVSVELEASFGTTFVKLLREVVKDAAKHLEQLAHIERFSPFIHIYNLYSAKFTLFDRAEYI